MKQARALLASFSMLVSFLDYYPALMIDATRFSKMSIDLQGYRELYPRRQNYFLLPIELRVLN
jgi:hypothetical protein